MKILKIIAVFSVFFILCTAVILGSIGFSTLSNPINPLLMKTVKGMENRIFFMIFDIITPIMCTGLLLDKKEHTVPKLNSRYFNVSDSGQITVSQNSWTFITERLPDSNTGKPYSSTHKSLRRLLVNDGNITTIAYYSLVDKKFYDSPLCKRERYVVKWQTLPEG